MRPRRNRTPWVCALTLIGSVTGACGDTGAKTGTNTNWLLACDVDTDCGKLAQCHCGTCTINCDAVTDCEQSGGTCSSTLAAAVQCGVASSLPLCLATCSSDVDCNDGLRCVSNSCVQVATSSACTGVASELACATFDDDTLNGWVPAVDTTATLDVVTEPALSGTASLRSLWPGRAIAERSFAPVLSGNLYGRFWIRLETDVSQAHVAQLDGDSGETAFRLVTEGTNAWVETVDGVVPSDTVTLSTAAWHCVRFTVVLSDTDGSLQVWLDESLVAKALGRDTLPATGVTGFQVGVGWANGDTTLYVDNALLSTEPVTCI